MSEIPFNKPFLTGKEKEYIGDVLDRLSISGNGKYTRQCQELLEKKYGFTKCLLTTSCTDALEMAAVLSCIGPGDEVIVPSYTFVSTANAFVLRGAKIVFADSYASHPNMDPGQLEGLITKRTKAIAVVHYAGVACDMDAIMELAGKHNLRVIEDAAQAIDSFYKGRPLGGIGHFGAFSFHETKNIISGEGGALLVNSAEHTGRAEIIWEKGTNRAAFFRGEIDKYGWVDVGSSFLPSEMISAFLFAQLEELDAIQQKRKKIWETYHQHLSGLSAKGYFQLPHVPDYATNNAHTFYLLCNTGEDRKGLLEQLKKNGIRASFHYLSLHKSQYYASQHDGRELKQADRYTDALVRLPLFNDLDPEQSEQVVQCITNYFRRK